MIKAGIIGATGYAGEEIVRILLQHKEVEICWYGSRSYVDQKYADIFRNLFEVVEDTCFDDKIEELYGEDIKNMIAALPDSNDK